MRVLVFSCCSNKLPQHSTGKGFPCSSVDKESDHNAEDLGLIPGLGRSPGEGKGYPLQYLAWRIPWTIQSMDHKEQT